MITRVARRCRGFSYPTIAPGSQQHKTAMIARHLSTSGTAAAETDDGEEEVEEKPRWPGGGGGGGGGNRPRMRPADARSPWRQQRFPPQAKAGRCDPDFRGFEVVFMGTASSMPTKFRNTTCIALRLDGTTYLIDCGEGAQRQFTQTEFRPRTIDRIFITHMHGDHIFGLPGVICMIGQQGSPGRPPTQIYGPVGLRAWLRTTLCLSEAGVPNKYAVHELVPPGGQRRSTRRGLSMLMEDPPHVDELPGRDIACGGDGLWLVHQDERYVVQAGALRHSVPCYGYVIAERTRPGRFSVEKALAAGVKPGVSYAMLQRGETITLPDGRLVRPMDVLGQSRRGRKAVILGDTCDSRSLLDVAQEADILVHEATLSDDIAGEAMKRGHSTSTMAGNFARAIDARKLILTHFSGKFEGAVNNQRFPDQIQNLNQDQAGGLGYSRSIKDMIRAARQAFGKPDVIAARDLMSVPVFLSDEPPVAKSAP
ncbi:hypothetical protein CBR_g12605 [Chara braunii]|uniref:Metallo-beta-lactamase domain-containing protein n=1 Tax=Chara braunii TaxID=69332 RepID=A0A388KS35_CHABU|nr:hypothetical protein CBR_g12605 [Chara braunii]|eukprot:GBG72885.1 hypothetical protein CBR_g12605 [Chara braunii]